jgi:hypothetical protein
MSKDNSNSTSTNTDSKILDLIGLASEDNNLCLKQHQHQIEQASTDSNAKKYGHVNIFY